MAQPDRRLRQVRFTQQGPQGPELDKRPRHRCRLGLSGLFGVLMQAHKGLEKVSSVDLLMEGLLTVRNRLNDVQERISEVDGIMHELMAYESRLKRVVKMQQAIELEAKE